VVVPRSVMDPLRFYGLTGYKMAGFGDADKDLTGNRVYFINYAPYVFDPAGRVQKKFDRRFRLRGRFYFNGIEVLVFETKADVL